MGEDKKSLNYAGCYGEYEYNYNNAEKELLLATARQSGRSTNGPRSPCRRRVPDRH